MKIKAALSIKQHEPTQQMEIQSGFIEIQETANAFKLMKEDLRTGEEKYRSIFENIQDVYYEATLTNKDGSTEYCAINASLKRDSDGEPQKIIGSLWVITDRKKADMELHRYRERLEDMVRERTRDLEKTLRELRNQMEARKEKEAQLRKSEEKYRSIIENMENGYYEFDLQGNMIFFNDPMAEILGYHRDELQGLNYRDLMDPKTARTVIDRHEAIRRTGRQEKLTRNTVTRKDGSRRTIEWTTALITDHEGEPTGYRGVVMDVSERLNAERNKKKLEERLQQIQRLEGIGTLAGGVAHDFNNLLMGIQGNVSLMLLEMDTDHTFYDKLKSIESYVTGGADLTRQLLGFARGGKYLVKPLDFNEITIHRRKTHLISPN